MCVKERPFPSLSGWMNSCWLVVKVNWLCVCPGDLLPGGPVVGCQMSRSGTSRVPWVTVAEPAPGAQEFPESIFDELLVRLRSA